MVEGDFVVISWLAKKERGSWRLYRRLHQIFNVFIELGYSIRWVPHLTNQLAAGLAKRGAKQLVSFVVDYVPPLSLSNVCFATCLNH